MRLEALLPEVRELMRTEIEADVRADTYYKCPRLSPRGMSAYIGLLERATATGDADSFVRSLKSPGLFNETELRKGKPVRVPSTAAETLGESEFNRYYCRGVCLYLLTQSLEAEVEVYRAKAVAVPRPESQRLLGHRMSAAVLLGDLRRGSLEAALGVPGGPNSGLSVRIPPPLAA